MLQRKYSFRGKLVGQGLIGSIDQKGERENKKQAIQVVTLSNSFKEGYRGYIFEANTSLEEESLKERGISYVVGVKDCEQLLDYDVVSINEQGFIRVQYRIDSGDNIIFITNHCNSNCIMCPEPEAIRKMHQNVDVEYLKEYISLIPDDAPHITITGGEPTLIREKLFDLLALCKERLNETDFLMLTNGRTFSIEDYAKKFLEVLPSYFQVGIPLYSHKAELHDSITRVKGSFSQTKKGIKHIGHRVAVEIRVVIMNNNYKELPQIAQMIVEEMPYIKTVSFMGLELLGNAALNKEEVWVDYQETTTYLEKAIITLIRGGIEASIYNYPLCAIPEKLWSISKKSITDYKVRYKDECETCMVKHKCGGFFFSTIQYDKISVKPYERGTN